MADVKVADAAQRQEFMKRLDQACDMHPHIPPKFKGRQSWIRTELSKRFDTKVTPETVSRWFTAEAKPRPTIMTQLAELLGVDVGWLSLGVTQELSLKERKARSAQADGAVNLVAGLIQLDGAVPAFPEGDPAVDIIAIIKGAAFSFNVMLGERREDGRVRFTAPEGAEKLFKIGVVREDGFAFRLFEITNSHFDTEELWSGAMIADVTEEELAGCEIFDFAHRP